VILDEIGRGTSTYDGLSLAWAVVEHLHNQIGCRTLFATHYHELTDLEQTLPGVANLNVAVKEWEGEVVFLHQIVPGAADKSYGIYVAQLAGVPREVNERAQEILAQLEDQGGDRKAEIGKILAVGLAPRLATGLAPRVDPPQKHAPHQRIQPNGQALQLTLFETADHPLLGIIRGTDLNSLTPLEVQDLVREWQEQLAGAGKVSHSKPK